MDYTTFKTLHLATVGITLALFLLRGFWMITGSPYLSARWVRIVPHLNDTVLLASGIALAWLLRISPLEHAWLGAKIVALLAYIGLGTIALKRGKTRKQRIAAWIAALAVFGYMAAVARSHDALPFLG
ncbi:MAG: SirB2 family protein [Pseudomonadota bacterium]